MRAFIVAAVLALVLAGCAAQRTMRLADGTEQTFSFGNGKPNPVEDAWVTVRGVGPAIEVPPGGGDAMAYWTFLVEPKGVDLQRVSVVEVGGEQVDPILTDHRVTLRNGAWVGKSEPHPVDSPAFAWLADGRGNLFVFRLTLEDAQEQKRVVYQPAYFDQGLDASVEAMREAKRRAGASPRR